MTLEDLRQGDTISITNIDGELHKADFLEFTQEGMYVNFKGFGHLEVKWTAIRLIEYSMSSIRRDNAYSPRYNVILWQQGR